MIPVAELVEYLGSDVVATDEPILEAMESAAVSLVSRVARDWYGAPMQFVDVLDGIGAPSVWALRTPRPEALPVVEERFLGGDWTTIDAQSILCMGRRVMRIDGGQFAQAPLNVRLTYNAGVEDADVFVSGGVLTRLEVRNAVRDVVRFLFREGRSWTLKDLASPAAVAVGGAAGVESVPSVQYIARMTYRAVV